MHRDDKLEEIIDQHRFVLFDNFTTRISADFIYDELENANSTVKNNIDQFYNILVVNVLSLLTIDKAFYLFLAAVIYPFLGDSYLELTLLSLVLLGLHELQAHTKGTMLRSSLHFLFYTAHVIVLNYLFQAAVLIIVTLITKMYWLIPCYIGYYIIDFILKFLIARPLYLYSKKKYSIGLHEIDIAVLNELRRITHQPVSLKKYCNKYIDFLNNTYKE